MGPAGVNKLGANVVMGRQVKINVVIRQTRAPISEECVGEPGELSRRWWMLGTVAVVLSISTFGSNPRADETGAFIEPAHVFDKRIAACARI